MNSPSSFEELGISETLQKACHLLQWTKPTPIQALAIPPALEGRNLVALAETGSGKTAAYALPIIQSLIKCPQSFFALVLAPTRELASQVQAQFAALGKAIGLSAILLVGGIPITQQADLMRVSPPHVLIATPGRLVDHMKKTKGFDELRFSNLRFLVIDEADRMLGSDFDTVLERILCMMPTTRQTFLFSATMTDKVGKLQRASVRDPVHVSTRKSKFESLANLRQFVHLVPQNHLDTYLVYLLRVALCPDLSAPSSLNVLRLEASPVPGEESVTNASVKPTSVIVFTKTRVASNRLNLLLRQFLRQPVIALNGDMPQAQRLGSLNKFKRSHGAVLVATDVASRGLDIPQVGLVVNYDVPLEAKTYMHRVGRTARAGRFGCALTLVTQYSVVFFLKEIECHLVTSGGSGQQRIPPLLLPGSSDDVAIEKAIEDLDVEVKEASSRANQAVESMRKRIRRSDSAGSLCKTTFTSVVDDLTTPSGSEQRCNIPGLRRTAWASEAPLAKRSEIAEVMQAMTTSSKNDATAESGSSVPNISRKRAMYKNKMPPSADRNYNRGRVGGKKPRWSSNKKKLTRGAVG